MQVILRSKVFVFSQTISYHIFTVIVIVGFLFSCGPKERAPGITQGFRALPLSTVSTTIDLPVNALSAGLNRRLPEILVNDTISLNKRGEQLFLVIKKQRDLKLAFRSGTIFAAVPVKVSVVAEKKMLGLVVSNREQPLQFSATVNFSGPFDLDTDWQPIFDFRLRSLEWERPPVFDLLGFRLDLTGVIDNQIREFGPELNEKLNKSIAESVELGAAIQNAWSRIQEPIRLVVAGDEFFYRMNMADLGASFLQSKIDTLSLDIQAFFKAEISQQMRDNEHMPLPDFTPMKGTVPLEIFLDTRLSFEYLNRKAAEFAGQSFEVEGQEVVLKSTRIYAEQGYVHCEVNFAGDSEGKITLYGIPEVGDDKVLTLDHFGYELVSDDNVLKVTDAAMHAGFERLIQEMLSVPLIDQLPELEARIFDGIERSNVGDKINLNLKIIDASLFEKGITADALQLIWRIEGQTKIELEQGIFEAKQ